MRYEDQLFDIDKDNEKLKKLAEDYEDIYERLSALEKEKVIDSDCLYNLVELTDMLIDVVAEKAENVKREVKYMGGRVLELKSEKIRRQSRKLEAKENFKLVSVLLKEKKYDELEKAAVDENYRNEMYKKYQIREVEEFDDETT